MHLVKNTTVVLGHLRLLMLNLAVLQTEKELSAYIVPSSDAHHNIRIADCDLRKTVLSGFDGSAGTLIITATQALLWTDARYYTQADMQLDENWTLMKESLTETPSQSEWLKRNLRDGDLVGVDPSLYSAQQWKSMKSDLESNGITLVAVGRNLVDIVWQERPPCSRNNVISLGLEFAGKRVSEKLAEVRDEMNSTGADVLVVTELDEIAWLLNLRGSDLPLAPVFFSFLILTQQQVTLFLDQELHSGILLELNQESGGNFTKLPYNFLIQEVEHHVNVSIGKIWMSNKCNYAISSLVPNNRQLFSSTPIALKKAIKNEVEAEGMRNALIRDSAALCAFYTWLEKEIKLGNSSENGQELTEISAANKLLSIREKQNNFVSLSFKTISATGPNGAIIHYFPTPETNRKLSIDEVYLIDAGAHYYDGTTDITRTFHFGNATEYMRDCYTRVLKGQIAVATAVFPNKTKGQKIDSFARRALWAVSRDYGHGTGHGVGHYLNVGEGPQSINSEYNADDPGLHENMFTSNEPGYYEEGQFGIRLENIIRVTQAHPSNGEKYTSFLGFEDLTFVPYQQNMINTDLLTSSEKKYLNEYQEKCRNITGKAILENGLGDDVYEWMLKETQPLL